MPTINVVFFTHWLLIYAVSFFYATNELYICSSIISIKQKEI